MCLFFKFYLFRVYNLSFDFSFFSTLVFMPHFSTRPFSRDQRKKCLEKIRKDGCWLHINCYAPSPVSHSEKNKVEKVYFGLYDDWNAFLFYYFESFQQWCLSPL